jgi:hypothetical protein
MQNVYRVLESRNWAWGPYQPEAETSLYWAQAEIHPGRELG